MTPAEFAKGWNLLITQTWGWRYSRMTDQGQPNEESATQLEFYYRELKWATGEAWMEEATRFARGDKWPSVNELQLALRYSNGRYVKALPQPGPELVPMPDDVRARIHAFVGKDL